MSMRLSSVLAALSCLVLTACNAPHQDTPSTTEGVSQSSASPAATSVAAAMTPVPVSPDSGKSLSCADEIGATAAEGRAKVCLTVSPATHPPCNAANSCAMIDDEIARSCALFDGQGAPMAGCELSPKSSEAAAAVVSRYYSALNARDYATAWQQWGENGPPNQTLGKFQTGFAHTRSTHVTIGKLEPAEGAAGSIIQTVPVIVDATLDDGSHQRFKGDYMVRRVNGVDGASAEQLRWHIGSARLVPAV